MAKYLRVLAIVLGAAICAGGLLSCGRLGASEGVTAQASTAVAMSEQAAEGVPSSEAAVAAYFNRMSLLLAPVVVVVLVVVVLVHRRTQQRR